MTLGSGPRVKGNDWSVLGAPDPGSFVPTQTVSVVVPAFRAHDTLPYTLAALAEQTYPPHLLEIIVVDDGDGPALTLPEVRPENARVITADASWGPANARAAGAAAAEGEVLHWLDSDMVPCRDHVSRQLRWHHVIDHAVVVGHKRFVDRQELPSVSDVRTAVADERLDDLFSGRWTEEHRWVEDIWRSTDDLRTAGFRAFHVHVGATGSVRRDLYEQAGGMDTSLKLSEDVELGYRLAMRGAVFIAERGATSLHLGRSHLMRHEQLVQRYNAPFVAQRVPDFRKFRQDRGRTYRVPYVEVVVEVDGAPWEQVKFTVDGVLRAQPADLHVLLVGPWSELRNGRRELLDDRDIDVRLVHEEFGSDPRVSLVETVDESSFPAQFRLRLPVGWSPDDTALERLTNEMQRRSQGLRSVALADGRVARVERTAAFERAARVRREGEHLDDVVDEVSATWWSDGVEAGFTCFAGSVPPTLPVTSTGRAESGGPVDSSPVAHPQPRRKLSRLRPDTFGRR